MSLVRKLMVLGGLAALLLSASASPASATTWSGDCTMTGTLKLYAPFRMHPTFAGYEGFADGTCTGSLDGAAYDGPASLYIDGRMNRPMACSVGQSLGPPGYLRFGEEGPELGISIDEFHVMTEMPTHVAGAYRGHALARVHWLGHVDRYTLLSCAAGPGVTSQDFDLELKTLQQLYG